MIKTKAKAPGTRMTGRELRKIRTEMYGEKYGSAGVDHLAELIGVSRATLYRAERRAVVPPLMAEAVRRVYLTWRFNRE